MRRATLEPAREALLADARARAERLLAQAEQDADALLAGARREAEELIARARDEGRAEGRALAARDAGHERVVTRWEVLAAQRASYDELCRRARAQAIHLREERGYEELLRRLQAAARRDLGEDAEIELDPHGRGGVLAAAGSRGVDYTLAALAERCVQDLGPALARLWA